MLFRAIALVKRNKFFNRLQVSSSGFVGELVNCQFDLAHFFDFTVYFGGNLCSHRSIDNRLQVLRAFWPALARAITFGKLGMLGRFAIADLIPLAVPRQHQWHRFEVVI